MTKKITLLLLSGLACIQIYAQSPRKSAHFLSSVNDANSTSRMINPRNSVDALGDTLFFLPVSYVYVNSADSATFAIHTYDLDHHTPNVNSIQDTAFGIYYSTSGGILFDPSQGDVDTGYSFLATSWFDTAATANNWLTFGPLTIPASGATLKWKHIEIDKAFRDGYEVKVSLTGYIPADFTSAAIFSVGDNSASTTNDTVLTPRLAHLSAATYGGQSVYFGFHHNAVDMNTLGLDAFLLQEGATVGIDEVSKNKEISLYPNPTNGIFRIQFNSEKSQAGILQVINALGQVVYNENLSMTAGSNNRHLDLKSLPSGIYSLNILSANESFAQKLIIQN